MVTYKFISAHKVLGVTPPAEREDNVLLKYPSLKAKALLTYEVDQHLAELDRASVVGSMMLKGLIGQGGTGTLQERMMREIEQLRAQRSKDIGSGVFVIFEAEGEVESWNPRDQKEFGDFILAFDGAPKAPIRNRYQAIINGILACFALASDSVCGLKKVTDGVYFLAEGDKPIYSFTFDASAKLTVSTALKSEAVDYIKRNAKSLAKHQELTDPARLLSRSLDEENDELLSFLSVWSGLEIFLGKAFQGYEADVFEQLSSAADAAAPSQFLERVRRVMKGKYNPVDKFLVVSHMLSPADAESDSVEFQRIKSIRDELMHGQEVAITSLPTESAGKLLRKYLKLHLDRPQG